MDVLVRSNTVRRAAALASLAALAAFLQACTVSGGGQGALATDRTSVEFDWSSKDGGKSGTMSAFVGFGLPFRGPFGEVTHTSPDGLTEAPLIAEIRDPAARDGSAAGAAKPGEVIADLAGPDRQSLVCSFHVNDPAKGMRSGANGECLFDGAIRVEARFPPRLS